MEQQNQFTEAEEPSYWNSVALAALLFAIVAFGLNTVLQYAMVSGSSGPLFSMGAGFAVCLIAAFGGMLAVWHYANEYDITFKLGKGALIGLLTGVGIAILALALGRLWQMIDPGLHQQIVENALEKLNNSNLSEAQVEAAKQRVKEGSSLLMQLLVSVLMYGIPNIITGMIGVPLFAKEEEAY